MVRLGSKDGLMDGLARRDGLVDDLDRKDGLVDSLGRRNMVVDGLATVNNQQIQLRTSSRAKFICNLDTRVAGDITHTCSSQWQECRIVIR